MKFYFFFFVTKQSAFVSKPAKHASKACKRDLFGLEAAIRQLQGDACAQKVRTLAFPRI